MGLDWDSLIAERNKWIEHNFPNEVDANPGLGSVIGVIEELGELAHAHLKEDQSIRGTAVLHQEAAMDAVGDLTVYLLGVMDRWRIRPHPVARSLTDDEPTDDDFSPSSELLLLAHFVGELARAHMVEARIQVGPAVVGIVTHLRYYCHARNWDYVVIVEQTWAGVKKRDWIKYPDTGLPPNAAGSP